MTTPHEAVELAFPRAGCSEELEALWDAKGWKGLSEFTARRWQAIWKDRGWTDEECTKTAAAWAGALPDAFANVSHPAQSFYTGP